MKKIFLLSILAMLTLSAQEIVSNGAVFVNSKPLTKETKIVTGDTIHTAKNATIRFNIGKDAFKAKGNSTFRLEKVGSKRVLNVVSGAVLGVFGGGNHGVATPNMTAGIRGTAIYAKVKANQTYFCTCYGETIVDSSKEQKHMHASHHEMVWIAKDGVIAPAHSMQGHSDDELRTLEKMVHRSCPFDKN